MEGRDAIRRKYEFANFREAYFEFMTAVAAEAERNDHHPECARAWSGRIFSLTGFFVRVQVVQRVQPRGGHLGDARMQWGQ